MNLVVSCEQFSWIIIDADRCDLKTDFILSESERKFFSFISINSSYGNDSFKKKQSWIANKIRQVEPDIVLTFTSANFSYRSIRKSFKRLKIFVLQAAYWKTNNVAISRKDYLVRSIYNRLKKAPVFQIKTDPIDNNKCTMYGLWSDSYLSKTAKGSILYRIVGNFGIDDAINKCKCNEINVQNAIYFTQPIAHYFGNESHNSNIRLLEEILSLNENLRIDIKVHPRDSHASYKKLQEVYPNRINWLGPDSSLVLNIRESDIIFTHYSTVIDIAVALNVPVLCLDALHEFENLLASKQVFIRTIHQATELNLKSDYFLSSRAREKERYDYLSKVGGNVDGNSMQRISDALVYFSDLIIN